VLLAAIIILPISYIFGDVVSGLSLALSAIDHRRDRCYHVPAYILHRQCLPRTVQCHLVLANRVQSMEPIAPAFGVSAMRAADDRLGYYL
jgi:hypothetical protein